MKYPTPARKKRIESTFQLGGSTVRKKNPSIIAASPEMLRRSGTYVRISLSFTPTKRLMSPPVAFSTTPTMRVSRSWMACEARSAPAPRTRSADARPS